MFTVPALPYDYDALEPVIDAQTMQIHHDKHHQGYVDKLNAALQEHPDLLAKPVQELLQDFSNLPAEVQPAVRNHGGGHANHTLFWQVLSSEGGDLPQGDLADAINQKFGSFKQFTQEFSSTAAAQFGSGWGWLVLAADDSLEILSTPNQDSPILMNKRPILGVDVWEHAYYLKYQNKRAEYLEQIWQVIDWSKVAELYQQALG